LKQQAVIPYVLVENGKSIGQLEAEIKKLNQPNTKNLKKESNELQHLVDLLYRLVVILTLII